MCRRGPNRFIFILLFLVAGILVFQDLRDKADRLRHPEDAPPAPVERPLPDPTQEPREFVLRSPEADTGHQPAEASIQNAPIHTGWPFGEEEAMRRQDETANLTGYPRTLEVPLAEGVAMTFRLIPAGEFMMGSPRSEEYRRPDEGKDGAVPRRITRPFYIAVHACTQAEWEAVTGANPSRNRGISPSLPVEMVNWRDVTERLLPALTPHTPPGMRFDLPTEAEWEYAFRAGSDAPYGHFGDDLSLEQANMDRRMGRPVEVGTYEPNPWGLYEMLGNVSEWCRDEYAPDAYATLPLEDPVLEGEGADRVHRGGSWNYYPYDCRAATRHRGRIDETYDCSVGVRLVLRIDPGDQPLPEED